MKIVFGFMIYFVLFTMLAYPVCMGFDKGLGQEGWLEWYIAAATVVTFLIVSNVISKWVFKVLEIE